MGGFSAHNNLKKHLYSSTYFVEIRSGNEGWDLNALLAFNIPHVPDESQ